MTCYFKSVLAFCLLFLNQTLTAQVVFRQYKILSDSSLHSNLKKPEFVVSYFDSRPLTNISIAKAPSERSSGLDSLHLRIVDNLVSGAVAGRLPCSDNWLRTIPAIPPIRLLSWESHRISSHFGWRVHPIHGKRQQHTGIDLPAPIGTPVYATADGTVQQILWNNERSGLTIRIKHLSGHESIYGHLSACAVHQGDVVRRGTVIGRVGTTGRSTGPHLHYAILYKRKPVNPERYYLLWLK